LVERSSELKAVMLRLLKAVETHDVETIRAMIDVSDLTMVIGSDPREWYVGSEAVELLTVSTAHSRTYQYDIRHLEAFEAGSIGWAAADTVVEFEPSLTGDVQLKSEPVPLRMTAIFVLDEGSWQVTFWHASVPTPDDPEVVGAELSEAMTEMIESLANGSEISELASQLQTNTVSLVFTDIVDSTLLTQRAGDVAWSDIVIKHLEGVKRIASRAGGVVVKTTGDGAMLAFGSARSAVRAASDLRDAQTDAGAGEPLHLRIGVHTGEAVKTEADYFGRTVNEAARIMAAAQPDQALVSEVTRSLVGDLEGVEFDVPITVELKGIPGMKQVYPIR
jgi:adenylate cyclase